MRVSLTDAGKRFNRDWIFRHLNYSFQTGNSYAIIGPNGSGKSTLLQVLSASMQLNEGDASWFSGDQPVSTDEVHQQVSICAPYLEVVEEMNLREFFEFHQQFKPFIASLGIGEIISIMGLERAVNKQIRYYSSGMKQRVKLAQAIFSATELLLLDEPCTNLDTTGVDLYHELVGNYCKDRLVVVSSNDEIEYRFCTERINLLDHKPVVTS